MPVHRRSVQVPLEVILSDEIYNEINALPPSRLEDLLGPVSSKVVESRGGTEFLDTEIDFLLRASGDVDGCGIVGKRELDAGDGNRRGACMPENRLARGVFANKVECLSGRNPCLQAT